MTLNRPFDDVSRFKSYPARLQVALLAIAGALAVAGIALEWPRSLIAGFAGLAVGAAAAFLIRESRALELSAARKDQAAGATDRGMLRSVIGALDAPAIALDGDLDIMAFNQRASELFPLIREGKHLSLASRHPELIDAVERASAEWRPRTQQIVDRAAQNRRLLVNISPLSLEQPGDTPPLLLVQFRDLTEQDRLAQMRSDFIANASHELRTPLASLKGFIETLQGPASSDPAAQVRFLKIMDSQTARMARILDDLLSLSRIEMRAYLPPADTVDLSAAVAHVVQAMEPVANDASIALKVEGIDAPCFVRGDGQELEQVFQNLIHNAIKYGKSGGRVDIALKREPAVGQRRGRASVSVKDDGPGIASEHLPRLTERFYRVDTATSRQRGGTGLGLAIVKHILNRHGGELKIASVEGRGSTFTVVLSALANAEAV